MLRSRPYPRTQAPRSVEEGGRIFRGDEGVDVESGGHQENFRLEDAVALIFDTLGHLHNRNGSYISTVKKWYKTDLLVGTQQMWLFFYVNESDKTKLVVYNNRFFALHSLKK